MNYDPNKKPINQSRRPELEMDDQWIIHFLHKTHFGHIAMRDGDQPLLLFPIKPVLTLQLICADLHQVYHHQS